MIDTDSLQSDLRNTIKKFGIEADDIVDSFLRTVNKRAPPPIVYHYTNDEGLQGIVESGKFRFTDIFNLNDPSELKHGSSRIFRGDSPALS